MSALRGLPNIGREPERRLALAGIDTPEKLCELGAREAFARVRADEPGACLSSLYALAGAVKGVRWHVLSAEEKRDLSVFFEQL